MNDENGVKESDSRPPAQQPEPAPQPEVGTAAPREDVSGVIHPPPRRKRSYAAPIAVGVGCLVLVVFPIGFFMLPALFGLMARTDSGARGGNLALIRVTGTITGGKGSAGVFGGGSTGAEDLVSQLEKARKDDGIKAIVIRINSPGGSAAGSEEVWNEIMRVRKSRKPVYASMADVAASGGYYIASACDRIYANGSTVTGSIGVIFSGADMSELYRKIGFRPEVIKSGKFKDTGSPARPLTAEERALLQTIVSGIHSRFVNAVSDGRKLPAAEVRKIADGRVLTGDQALKLRLVDKIGGLHETTRAAADAGGIKGEPRVVDYQRKGLLGALLGDDVSSEIQRGIAREVAEGVLRETTLPGSLR